MTRLSILDIAGGHQPMFDERRRYALVFNGEIYNYRDLWDELVALGHEFKTDHSDTEVIVHGFEEWGTALFERLNGMFAIAIWDHEVQELTLARDRAGEKPLYVAELNGGGWAFASEMKALLAHPDLDRTIDVMALEEFLAFDFVLAPRTILKSVSKLPAGCFASITANGLSTTRYWMPRQVMVQSLGRRGSGRAGPAARRVGAVANGRGRPGRPLPQRRPGLDDDRLVHGAPQPRRSCIHHRLRGSSVRRVPGSRSRRRAPRGVPTGAHLLG